MDEIDSYIVKYKYNKITILLRRSDNFFIFNFNFPLFLFAPSIRDRITAQVHIACTGREDILRFGAYDEPANISTTSMDHYR